MNAKNVKYAGYLLIFAIVFLATTGTESILWRLIGLVPLAVGVTWLTVVIEDTARTKNRRDR